MSLDVSLIENNEVVYDFNITHNLNTMAAKAGIYEAMWRPDEIGAVKAKDIVSILQGGVMYLISNKKELSEFNPTNCWGSYEGLLATAIDYLQACIENPDATIEVSR